MSYRTRAMPMVRQMQQGFGLNRHRTQLSSRMSQAAMTGAGSRVHPIQRSCPPGQGWAWKRPFPRRPRPVIFDPSLGRGRTVGGRATPAARFDARQARFEDALHEMSARLSSIGCYLTTTHDALRNIAVRSRRSNPGSTVSSAASTSPTRRDEELCNVSLEFPRITLLFLPLRKGRTYGKLETDGLIALASRRYERSPQSDYPTSQ